MNTSKNSLVSKSSRAYPLGSEGRDERDNRDEAGIDHEPGNFRDTPDVLHPVGISEAEIAIEAVPDVVAIQDVGVHAALEEQLLKFVCDRRLAGARETREPQAAT